jgi:hypothetical protein|tara:strand:+ start:535 stop:984 length:450 start_codon:yes stop_codon:yes gene_type:complete
MRTSKTIKDPTFNIYRRGGSVEKAMESKGDGKAKEELMQLAKDEKDILFDVESEITDILLDNYNKEKKPGQSFLDWLGTKDREYLIKIPLGLASGGKVISISEYLKQKEKPRIKKLNLDAVAPGKALSELTDAEREVVRNLLRMTFGQD